MHAEARRPEPGEWSTKLPVLTSSSNNSHVATLFVSAQKRGTPAVTWSDHFWGKSAVSSGKIFCLSLIEIRAKDVRGGGATHMNVVQCDVASPAALKPIARALTPCFPLLVGMDM
jgi:hypothetical protein